MLRQILKASALIVLPLVLVCGFALPLASHAQSNQPTSNTLSLLSMESFQPVASNWTIVGGVASNRNQRHSLSSIGGNGVLINVPTESARKNLFTIQEHGDLDLEMEFLMPKESNSGIYLQGRYEVQLLDSWGKKHPSYSDLGGIYERWDDSREEGDKGYEGIPPRINASRAPGLWQHLKIRFQAPRFDAQGNKVLNARFLEVTLNGSRIHENVEVTGPTRGAAFEDEAPIGPLMIQGDHGPVAFRDIGFKSYRPLRVSLSDVDYIISEGEFESVPDLTNLPLLTKGESAGLRWDTGGPTDKFAIQHNAALSIPLAGTYTFHLQLDWITGDPHFRDRRIGGGVLTINEDTVLVHDGTARSIGASVELEAGTYPLSLSYYKNRGWARHSFILWAEGTEIPLHTLNEPGTLPLPSPQGPIVVNPSDDPYVLRTMIQHGETKRTHAVAVGHPTGVHYALDLQHGGLLHAWRGPFVETTPMWHSRGNDQLARPLGSVLTFSGSPTVALLDDADASWPDSVGFEGEYRLKGYSLDHEGIPTFSFQIGDVLVEDRLSPKSEARVLHRTLSFHDNARTTSLWVRLATGNRIESLPDGSYSIGDRSYYLEIDKNGSSAPLLRTTEQGQELLLPIRFTNQQARVSYAIIW